jgi:hypothetical protein
MNVRKISGAYAVFMGVAMFMMWAALIGTDQVPELDTEPIRVSFHLAGEFLTAIALMVGGLGLIRYHRWGFDLYLVSMGMLSYTVIVSPGYYGQEGEFAFVGMFLVFVAVTALLIACALRDDSALRGHRVEETQ